MTDTSQMAAAGAVAGFALWTMFERYSDTAPKLSELRQAHRNDTAARQQLRDADIMVGGMSVLAGSAASYLSKSWIPLVTIMVGFISTAWYYHYVQSGLTIGQIDPTYKGN